MTAAGLRRFTLPTWRGGAVLTAVESADLENYTRLAVDLDGLPDEAAVAYLEQIVAYAWKRRMNGAPAIGEGAVSVHDALVVFDADVRARNIRSRTRTRATHELVTDLRSMYYAGSPIRKDGMRLIERPDGLDLDLIGILVG